MESTSHLAVLAEIVECATNLRFHYGLSFISATSQRRGDKRVTSDRAEHSRREFRFLQYAVSITGLVLERIVRRKMLELLRK